MTEINEAAVAAVDVERGGYARYPVSTTIQFTEETLEIARLIGHGTRRSAGDVLREAIEDRGLREVVGYTDAREAYLRGERAPRKSAPERKRGTRGGTKGRAKKNGAAGPQTRA